MEAKKADHFAFRVSNLDSAIKFYTKHLGMKLMFQHLDKEHQEAFAFLELEGSNLELLQLLDEHGKPVPVRRSTPDPLNCPHLALSATRLDLWKMYFQANKIPVVKGPMTIPNKVTWLYFSDPDGNILELVEWLSA